MLPPFVLALCALAPSLQGALGHESLATQQTLLDGPRLRLIEGRLHLLQGQRLHEVWDTERHFLAPGPWALSAPAAAAYRMTFPLGSVLDVRGPASLEGPTEVTEGACCVDRWVLSQARQVDVDVQRQPMHVEAFGEWRLELPVGIYRLESLPGGDLRLTCVAGGPAVAQSLLQEAARWQVGPERIVVLEALGQCLPTWVEAHRSPSSPGTRIRPAVAQAGSVWLPKALRKAEVRVAADTSAWYPPLEPNLGPMGLGPVGRDSAASPLANASDAAPTQAGPGLHPEGSLHPPRGMDRPLRPGGVKALPDVPEAERPEIGSDWVRVASLFFQDRPGLEIERRSKSLFVVKVQDSLGERVWMRGQRFDVLLDRGAHLVVDDEGWPLSMGGNLRVWRRGQGSTAGAVRTSHARRLTLELGERWQAADSGN